MSTADPHGAAASFAIDGVALEAPPIEPALHVVATPIGNLEDVTLRALRTIAAADVVACEDTRVTARLLERYAIRTRTVSYNDHNAASRRGRLLGALAKGRSVALLSDAGTPLVSDPGYRLVREAIAAGHRVLAVPGPSALLAGLAVSGLPSDAFLFAGFLPAKRSARRRRLAELAAVPATLCFFESRQRLAAALEDMADAFGGEREAAVLRELTKVYEEAIRGRLDAVTVAIRDRDEIRGELMVAVGPPAAPAPADDAEIDRLLASALADKPPGPAAAEVAARLGLPRKAVYARAIALRGDAPDREVDAGTGGGPD